MRDGGMEWNFGNGNRIVRTSNQIPERINAEGIVKELIPIGDFVSIVWSTASLGKYQQGGGILIIRPEKRGLGPATEGLHSLERTSEPVSR